MKRCDETAAWAALQGHFEAHGRDLDLREAFARDPGRFEAMAVQAPEVFADLSKNLLDVATLHFLLDLARECGLEAQRDAMFAGVAINNTEGTLSLTKIGTGIQTLSGISNFGGVVTVTGGLLAFPSSAATAGPLGNSTAVNLNGGGISYTASGSNALNRPIAIGAADGTVDVASSTGVLSIETLTSTAGDLIKTGPGTSVIAGSTTLNGGSAGVAVNEGTLKAGFGSAGVATLSVGATGNLDQSNSVIESLTLGNDSGALTLSGGAQLGFELSGATNDSIAVGALIRNVVGRGDGDVAGGGDNVAAGRGHRVDARAAARGVHVAGDGDVLVVGEMRDFEAISTALTAAETGHLVLATMHSPNVSHALERIIDVMNAPRLL